MNVLVSESGPMYEFLWLTSPFDDDDDDFAFEEGHAELAAEIREYDDEDADEFGDEPVPPPAKKAVTKKKAAKKMPAVRKR